jgi:hypothetical protein
MKNRTAHLAAMIGALLPAPLLVACGSAKSDFDNVCNSEARVGATGKTPEDYNKAMKWAAANVKTDEVKKFMGSLATIDPSSKAGALRQEAAKAGVSPCPLADSWESSAKKPSAAP